MQFLLDKNDPLLLEEKARFLQTASKTNTAGTVIGPVLTGALVFKEADLTFLITWLSVMFVCVTYRAYVVFIKNKNQEISNNQKIRNLSYGVLSVTLCWGLGWIIVVPGLPFNLQCLYLLMSSTAIFVGLYGYSIHRLTFLCFALPIFIPQFVISLIPPFIFPWPIILGEFAFSLYALKMASYFSDSWIRTVSLQIQNQILNKSLELERNAAIAANVAKSKFIATASHDLRQPLHAVNIYLDLFDTQIFNLKDRNNFFQIKNSIQSLNSMFNSLLDLSKLDAGAPENLHNPFELSKLISNLHNTYAPVAVDKNIALSIEYVNVMVEGDILLLQQLLGNLISNAIYYTSKGSVVVAFSNKNNKLHINIADTGCGIDSSAIQKVFDEFYRVDTTRNMHDGLGLGLSIVKRLSTIIHAELKLHSELGVGTTFNIQTTYSISQLSDVDNEPIEDVNIPDIFNRNVSFATKVIAIFEDDLTIFHAYEKLLAQQLCTVISLSENSDVLASQLANINRIDCIISDFRLQHTTGDLIIQQLRDSFGIDIPAIIITADTAPEHIQLFNALNVTVLYKPIGYEDIVNAIQPLLIEQTATQ
jgi:signal transduction histidine kinase/CheY-like chemotaxis protein